eukprot:gene5917-7547_t
MSKVFTPSSSSTDATGAPQGLAKFPSLQGRAVFVTGGGSGIGAAIVRRLAEDGADVAFSYSASPERAQQVVGAVEALGRRALAIKADQASPAAVEALVREVHAAFGRLDILVNSAGVFVTGMVDDPTADRAAFDR